MKTITIEIPDNYNWVCKQPYGCYLFSVERPIISTNSDYYDREETQLIEFWEVENGDYEELDFHDLASIH